MIDIVLSDQDIARIRFAVSPASQVAASAATNIPVAEPTAHRRAQRQAFHRLGARAGPLMQLRGLAEYTLPDFATPPPTGSVSLDSELEAIRGTPPHRVFGDLMPWFDRSFDQHAELVTSSSARLKLVEAIRSYHRDVWGTDWDSARRLLERDVRSRAALMARHGIDRVLSTLHPRIRWRNPVLTIGLSRAEIPRRYPLEGRGVILVPSLSWATTVTTKLNPVDPLVLVYPVGSRSGTRPRVSAQRRAALARALGASRASIFVELLDSPGLSTTEVARACRLSVPSASEHLHVLQELGLSRSFRDGHHVRHGLTELGWRFAAGP